MQETVTVPTEAPTAPPPPAVDHSSEMAEIRTALNELREAAQVPVALDEIYRRLDAELRPYSTLLAVAQPRENVLDEPEFEIFRADLMNDGRVTKIDLVKEGYKAGVIGETETAIARWTNWPVPR
jgi:hypothetical protein